MAFKTRSKKEEHYIGRTGSVKNQIYRMILENPEGINTNEIVLFFLPEDKSQVYNALISLRNLDVIKYEFTRVGNPPRKSRRYFPKV